MSRTFCFVALVVFALAPAGCKSSRAPTTTTAPVEEQQPPTTQTRPAGETPGTGEGPEAPDLPLELDKDALVSKVLIKDTTVADRHRREKYKQDPLLPAGTLRGVCFIPFDTQVNVPADLPIWPEGPNAIKDPQEGELEYFKGHCPRRPFPIGPYDRQKKRYGVRRAILIVRGVKAGRRSRLGRPSFVVNYKNGLLEVPQAGYNHGLENVGFGPLYERVQLANTEFFDSEIRITNVNAGKVFFEEKLSGYNDPRYPRVRYGLKWGMAPLRLVQTPPLLEMGLYSIACKKHPWQRAHLFVVDNPYVCASGSDGSFAIEGVPEGEYAVDVWHPEYEPIRTSLKVKVEADKTTEIPIRFKPPAVLTSPMVPTKLPVQRWVYAGPFELEVKDAFPPEKEIDFNATYKGKGDAKASWRLINANAAGVVDVRSVLHAKAHGATWYVAAVIKSPAEQKILFGARIPSESKFWLNGELLYVRPYYGPGLYYVMGTLKCGTNKLLVRLNVGPRWQYNASVALNYDSPGAEVIGPEAEHLRTGYVPDELHPAGSIQGVCYVPFDKPVHIPRLVQIDLTGKMALAEPQEGESDHYHGPRRPARPVLLGAFDPKLKRYAVRRAVVLLKDVRTGRRLPLTPTQFRVNGDIGDFEMSADRRNHYGWDTIGFSPVGEPVGIVAADVFGYHVLLKQASTGKVVAQVPLPPYKDKYFPGEPHNPRRGGMSQPKVVSLPPVAEPGRYLITCKRHPWCRGHLFVTKHPYVAVSDDNGGFRIDGLPAGKHVVEVWHPDFQCQEKAFAVEVKPDKPTELKVAFKVPDLLGKAVQRTDQTIIEWVYAGPFEGNHGKAYPPEEKVDFQASYPRKDRSPVGWRRVNADANGYLDLCRLIGRHTRQATWYLCSLIESPKPQQVTFGVGCQQYAKLFLNGRCIYDRPYYRRWAKDEDYALGALQAGQNLLMLKLTNADQWPSASVTFKADKAKALVPPDKALLPPYVRDDRVPTGQLTGRCYVPFDKEVSLPARYPLDLGGKNAVRDPEKGEVAFHERNLPTAAVWLGSYDGTKKRYPVVNAAVMLRDVKSGRRFPLTPTGLTVNYASSQPETGNDQNYGRYQIAFSRSGETVALATGEVFGTHMLLTKAGAGKPFCEVPLKPYADERYPGKCYGQVQYMVPPKGVSTPPVGERGRYVLTDKRHPWRKAYVFVVDHPYVDVTERDGRFQMDEVPAGKYAVEVWHPDFQPVAGATEVEIAPGKTAGVEIAFKCPDILTKPPQTPTRAVKQWVGIGPFAPRWKVKQPHPPEEKIDFKAACEGKGKASVRWRVLNPDKEGLVNLSALEGGKVRDATWYLTTTLECPKKQKAVFGLGSPEAATVWLNGQVICDWPNRTNSWSRNQDYVVGNLNAGRNTLLVRLDTAGNNCGVVVTYDAKGVEDAVPADRHLREGYVHDGSIAGGTLEGVCYVPFDKPVHVPRLVQLDLSGEMALRDPQAGELERYRGPHRPAAGVLFGGFDAGRKRYGVSHAVIRVKGIRSGRRLPLKRNALEIDPHVSRFQVVSHGHNYSRDNIVFTPAGESLSLTAADIFGYHVTLTNADTAAAVFDAAVEPYKDEKHPGLPYDRYRQGMAPPKTIRIGPLAESGRYVLAARRRPWCRAHVFVTTHPYVASTGADGAFKIDHLPPGKHVVEVWHPGFKPVKKTFEVEVAPGKSTELKVPFEVPDAISKPPQYADQTITEWLYVGPLAYGLDTPRPPEEKLDLKAKHEGKYKDPVAWQRVNATRDGHVDLWRATGRYVRDATWYCCAMIDSPKDQPVTLAVGSSELCRLWLNGQAVYEYRQGHRWRKDEDIVLGRLQAGRNVLLAKVCNGGEPGLSVSFKAPGAKVSVPTDAYLQPRYIRDDRPPRGNLRGRCFVPFDKPVYLPPCWPIRPAGRNAIRKPVKGELEHFESCFPTKPVWLGRFDEANKRYPLAMAAVVLHSVKKGMRSPLSAAGLTISWASSQPEIGQNVNFGRYNMAFAPAQVPLGLATGEVFPAHLVLATAAGKVAGEFALAAYQDKRYPGRGYGQVGGMERPKGVQTPPLPPGRYALTCKRHPWKKAHLFLSDHPYVGLTDGNGNFTIDDVPAGKYALEVWHGDCGPVKQRIGVEVVKGKTTDVDVAFKAPGFLRRPPPVPRQKASQWACVGPFPQDHEQRRSYAPEKDLPKGIDFKAVYEDGDPARLGKGRTKVAWRLYNADAAGALNLSAQLGDLTNSTVWYAAATLHSPGAQKALFGLGTPEASRVWINGEPVFTWPHRTGSVAANQGYFLAPLKRGANAVLVRVNSVGNNAMSKLTWQSPAVKAAAPRDPHLVRPYMWADSPAVGAIKGICFVPFDKPVQFPRMVQMDPVAVHAPAKGEAEHYSGPGRPGRPVWLGGFDAANKRYPVRRAAITIRGIRAGKRLPLNPMRVQVNPDWGWIETFSRGFNNTWDLISFCPAGDELDVTATDIFPYTLQVRDAAGKVLSETPLGAYKDEKRPGRAYRPGMAGPATVELPAIAAPGRYLLTCKRHPWVQGHLFASHHPYVAVSDDSGGFTIDNLPVGRHTVDVWHPDFPPARNSFQVNVTADKPAELKVEFKVPAILARPPAHTDQTIVEWVCAGPFDHSHDAVNPPEEKVDFRAKHQGKGKAPVVWRRVNAARDGHLNLAAATGISAGASTWYFCSLVQSPGAQPVAFGVGSSEQCKLWLNGRLLYDRPDGHGWRKDEDIVKGALRGGANVLLVKLTRGDGRPDMSVTFKAPGAKAAVPPDRHLRPAYLWDERPETGQISGVCFAPFEKQVSFPSRLPVERTGKYAVVDPQPGEAEYYRSRLFTRPVLLGGFDAGKKHYRLANVAVILRGVTRGKRYPFGPTGFTVDFRSSQLQTGHNQNYGRENIGFAPVGLGVQLANGEVFGGRFALTRAADRKTVCEVALPAYKDKRFPGKCYGEVGGTAGPATVATSPIPAPGRYLLSCKRHPWKQAHLFAVEHPYVALSDGNGGFSITDVPAGKYTIEVWHPDYAPVKRAVPVVVTAGKATGVEVSFKPPPVLTSPPPMPDVPIRQWAFLGPFDTGKEPAEIAEGPPKLKAAYPGRGGVKVAWKPVEADRVDLAAAAGKQFKNVANATAYLFTFVDSPKAQNLVLSISADDGASLWLNGRYVRGAGAYMVFKLNPGRNALLVKLINSTGSGGLSASCHAEGATLVAPLAKKKEPAKKPQPKAK